MQQVAYALAAVALAIAVAMTVGCGAPPAQRQLTSFAAAEQTTQAVTIEGIAIRDSITRSSQGSMEFTLREESSAREMKVLASPDAIPANLGTAKYVTVTGTYDPQAKQFQATRIETR